MKDQEVLSAVDMVGGLPALRVCHHFPAQYLVHVGLIFLATTSKPGKNLRINPEADQLFDGSIETTPLNRRGLRKNLGAVGIIDLFVWKRRQSPEFVALGFRQGRRKELARGDSLFLRK